MRVAAILLAAGEGRRIGGTKALLRVGAESFLARCARLLARPGVMQVVVVLGHDADRVVALAGIPASALVVRNPGFREGGMLSSILRGLDAAEGAGAEAVLLHPVDHPFVAEATVDRVIAALVAGASLAVPSSDGRRGHPGGFARDVWQALRLAPPERGARALLQDAAAGVVHVPGDPGCLAGVDTPLDLKQALARFAPEARGVKEC